MNESVIIVLVKKYLWQFIATAICLTMFHNALENIGGGSKWVKVSLSVVNGLYASFFFALFGGYYFGEFGIVLGVLAGSALGFASVKEVSSIIIKNTGKR